jgi:hypothetical protein|tara:strand:+ start:541 stop:789 length:249 start_codon:yes stop_codon:yes gene_type:complete
MKMPEDLQNKILLRPKEVEKYYGIKSNTIYNWFKLEQTTGEKAPVKISNPGSRTDKRGQVFVNHQSIIDYFNSGLNSSTEKQ